MALSRKLVSVESRWNPVVDKVQKAGIHRVFYSPTGDQYKGEWRYSMRHGLGTQVWKKSKMLYQGEWQNHLRHGNGTMYKMLPSGKQYGEVYSGQWRNDKKNGFGLFFYSMTAHYEGLWVDDERSGWGVMRYENGDVYEGQWLKDKPHGQGVLTLSKKNRYEGCMKDGKKHGHGRFIYMDKNQVYEGFWVNDVPKCGTVCEYNTEDTCLPKRTIIPRVLLQDVQEVLEDGCSRYSRAETN